MTTARIEVRTEGPRQWSIATGQRVEAERARTAFLAKGLDCGPIRRQTDGYVFTADCYVFTADCRRVADEPRMRLRDAESPTATG